jgi:ribokinase
MLRVLAPDLARRVDVAVVGTVNLDATIHVPALPVPGASVVGEAVGSVAGGKGANQAVAAARQGARTALIGCVGSDAAGDELRAVLEREPRLDVSGLRVVDAPTGRAYVTVDDEGDNTIVSARGANGLLDDLWVHRQGRHIGEAAVLLVQLGVARDAACAALEVARSVGTITVLDPSPASEVTDELLRLTDLCTPNAVEAELLTGVVIDDVPTARRAAARLRARGCAGVVVTLGARGAYAQLGDGVDMTLAPISVASVDPTAAGDAFNGALAASLARGEALADALADGTVAGALATSGWGALPSLPTRAEVVARRRHA